MNISSNTYKLATTQHADYNQNKATWQFLLESYVGGDTYKQAGYLTRYVNESASDYQARLNNTPVDNHCASVISIYTSFLFKNKPTRDLGHIEADVAATSFLSDVDYEGRSLDNFIKEASIWSSVFGHAFILLAKPNINAVTKADEIAYGVRPYATLLTPLTVTDWSWKRSPIGRYELEYFKYVEEVNGSETTIRAWTKEHVYTWVVDTIRHTLVSELIENNELGIIPVVTVYNRKSTTRDKGISDIQDIAYHQQKIFNELSEIEQAIRLNGHPALVKTAGTLASAGAGAIIQVEDNMDPGLKPYLLAVSANTNLIYDSVRYSVESIDRMASVGAVRMTRTQSLSGVAMETEFSLLDAKLSEKADNLELAEEQLWRLYAAYQNITYNAVIKYPDAFMIRDDEKQMRQLETASAIVQDVELKAKIDTKIAELLNIDK